MQKRVVNNSERVKVSFLTSEINCKALDELAGLLERDRTYVINEAISSYLEIQKWQLLDTRKAVEEAIAGDFASDEEVAQAFAKYKNAR